MDMNKTAELWAKNNVVSEAEAFETVIKRIKNDFKVDDEVEQAYRQGWHDGFKCCNDKMVSKLMNENAELRDMVKVQSEQILRLRECINRNHEDFYE